MQQLLPFSFLRIYILYYVFIVVAITSLSLCPTWVIGHSPDANGILYVNQTVSGGSGSGNSWPNAIQELADALKEAKTNTNIKEIWVAKGTYLPKYKPAAADNNGDPTTDIDKTFLLVKDVKVYGGFDPESGKVDMETRDPRLATTILSGNLGAPGVNTDNARHVVLSVGHVGTAVLDGFTVSDGYAFGGAASLNVNSKDLQRYVGAGLYLVESSPLIRQVNVSNNMAMGSGAGMYLTYSSSALTNVRLSNNVTYGSGGGIFNANSSPVLTNVLIDNNSASSQGGGMVNGISSPVLTNVTIYGNQGGGVVNHSNSDPLIRNSIIYGNSGYDLRNNNDYDTPNISHSLIQGSGGSTAWNSLYSIDGGHNIDMDPLFADAAHGNFRLQVGSPAIDVGNNTLFYAGKTPDISAITTDMDGNPRIVSGIIDLGVYETVGGLKPDVNGIIYVKAVATGSGNGESWGDATGNLQGAIDADGVQQVWVATGTYQAHPYSFRMKNGVAIYGGFDLENGVVDISGDRILPALNNVPGSILSGGNQRSPVANIFSESDPLDDTAILDGFTLTGGTGTDNGWGSGTYGGGMYNAYASPVLKNLLITENTVTASGGGVYNNNSSPEMTHVTVSRNTAGNQGGGIYMGRGNVQLTNVLVKGNTATEGGGVYLFDTHGTLINVAITGNTATGSNTGSAIHTYSGINRFIQATIAGNNGTAFHNGATNYLDNTILYGGTNGLLFFAGTNHSLIEGNPTPDMNLNATNIPIHAIFSNPSGDDYSLRSNSKAVNAGNSNLYPGLDGDTRDLADNARLFGTEIDLGAYELQVTPTVDISPDPDRIIYVDKNVNGGNGSGDSWPNAITELADALLWATDNQTDWTETRPLNIYIAQGIYLPRYKPTVTDNQHVPTTDRDKSFVLGANIHLYGGFDPGNDIKTLADRCILPHQGIGEGTVLSGDLDNNDGPGFVNNDHNAYHVLIIPMTADGFVIDGLTIRGGNANGGATYINVQGTTSERRYGGGILNTATGIIRNSRISGNRTKSGGGSSVSGGGMFSIANNTLFANLVVRDNYSEDSGGGISVNGGAPKFINTVISANQADLGAGIFSVGASVELVNCTVTQNNADNAGGGISFFDMHYQARFNNSIVWGNTAPSAPEVYGFGGLTQVNNSIIKGGSYGSLNLDPLFNQPATGDYTLKKGSPAIDKGNNALYPDLSSDTKDLAGNPRVYSYDDEGIIDMGAYESSFSAIRPDLQGVVYVRSVATGNGSGRSWDNATSDLQEAIHTDGVQQVWVAVGTYEVPPTHSFVMKNNVAIYGGFDPEHGIDDLDDNRVLPNHGNSDGSVLMGQNQYPVIDNNSLTHTAVLDGFTITGGVNAQYGGGIANMLASPVLRNLVIKGNSALYDGGAIYNYGSSPVLSHVIIVDNTAMFGGAMSNWDASNPVLVNVVLSRNTASLEGGAIYNFTSSPELINTTVFGNNATEGSALHNNFGSSPQIHNSVIYGHTGQSIVNFDGIQDVPVFSYSLVQGSGGSVVWDSALGTDGGHNIDVDPEFTDAANGDYTLQAGSPAIDAGSNQLYWNVVNGGVFLPSLLGVDLAGNARLVGAEIDMGAYELQRQAQIIHPIADISKTYGDADFEPEAMASSGLEVAYNSADNSIVEAWQDATDGNKWKLKIKKSGTVKITVSQPGDGGYLPAPDVEFNLIVNKKEVTVSFADAVVSKVYDGNTDGSITVANLCFAPGDIISGDDVQIQLATTAISYDTKDVGIDKTVTLTLSSIAIVGIDVDSYELSNDTDLSASIGTITAAPLTVTANAGQGKVYDEVDPALTYQVTGFRGMDGESILTGALTRAAGEDVGNYMITQGDLSAGDNYAINFVGDNFVINKATITGITFTDESFVYDGTVRSLVITGTLPQGASISYTGNAQINTGIYNVTASIDGGNNYNNLVLNAVLTIGRADITGITFNNANFVYDGTARSLVITGTLPQGASVSYTGNAQTNAGMYNVTASIDGGNNYNNLTLNAVLTIGKADITGITFNNANFVYDGSARSLVITGTLPQGASVSYTGNAQTNAGTYNVTASIDGGTNYNNLTLNAVLTVGKADITGITFNNANFVYDGTARSLAIAGTLPQGASVSYTGNVQTNAGMYNVTASIDGGTNYNNMVLNAMLTIGKADITGITFNNANFVYDGTARSLAIADALPQGASVSYTDNTQTNAGTYTVTANIDGGTNYNNLTLNAVLTIDKADITGITFNDANFVYDGSAKSLAIAGTLPQGVSVSYTGNAQTNAGMYNVTANIDGGTNYNNLTLNAVLIIDKANITGITFNNANFVYDSSARSLVITGTLPQGASVSYTGNAQTNAGTYNVTANIDGGNNYHDLTLNAVLTIGKADITGITFNNANFVYDGSARSLAITGTLPQGASVSYTGNAQTNAGTYNVTASIDGGTNYNNLILNAVLTIGKADITGITFNNANFVYDGSAKSLTITGTLPQGTHVSYIGNVQINAGTYTVTANIAGGTNYNDLSLQTTLAIAKAPQTITFVSPGVLGRDAGTVTLDVKSSSDLPIQLTIDDEMIATVNSASLSMTVSRLGTVIVTATQMGNENYLPAEPLSVTIRIANDADSKLPIRVHQAVSPNGDGINEFLQIEGIRDYPENKVTIFDKSGKVLAEIEGYDNRDRVFTGQYVNDGAYYYYLDIRDRGHWKREKGFFVVKRTVN